jgi:hypothetical protein
MDLLARLADSEDRFVERKPTAAGNGDFKRTIVAFANSVPENRVAVLFVGIGDNGEPHGVPDPDKMQKKMRQIGENECYPPIFVDSEVVRVGEKSVVAVLVSWSNLRPHFAGPAYVRRGSESVNASDSEYDALLNSRLSIVRQLQEWKGRVVTITEVAKQLGEYFPISENHHKSDVYEIVDVNAHYVRFKRHGSGTFVTEIVDSLRLSWDEGYDRPRLLAFPVRRASA